MNEPERAPQTSTSERKAVVWRSVKTDPPDWGDPRLVLIKVNEENGGQVVARSASYVTLYASAYDFWAEIPDPPEGL